MALCEAQFKTVPEQLAARTVQPRAGLLGFAKEQSTVSGIPAQ